MNEILLLLLPIIGVFAVGCSIALIALGKIIDRFPAGDESARERSLASPIESTRIAVVIFWILFLIGGWAIFQETRFGLILGITTLFSVCLFMFTALIFSFAVISTMRRQRDTARKNVQPILITENYVPPAPTDPVPPTSSHTQYSRPVPSFMVDTFLKKN
jgi:hypothetical protein